MLYFGISVPNTGVLELLHPNSEVTRSPNFNTQNQASFTDLHACGGWREPYCRSVQETRSTKSISQFYLWTTTYRIKITGECSMSRGHSAPQGDQLTRWPGRDHQEHPGETPLYVAWLKLKSLFHPEDRKQKTKEGSKSCEVDLLSLDFAIKTVK